MNKDLLDKNSSKPRTIVVCPGITFPDWIYAEITGLRYFEERLLYFLFHCKYPGQRLIYLLSEALDPEELHYWITTAAAAMNMSSQVLKERLTIITVNDTSDKGLAQKILASPKVIELIKNEITETSNTYLEVFAVSQHEIQLAKDLGIPYWGNTPTALKYDQKGPARELAKSVGVKVAPGKENINNLTGAYAAWKELGAKPGKYMLKINTGDGGVGLWKIDMSQNKVLDFTNFRKTIPETKLTDRLEELLSNEGGILEQYIEAPIKISPSIQYLAWSATDFTYIGAHEQDLADDKYVGSYFPAESDQASSMREAGDLIMHELIKNGVRGRVSMDFLLTKNSPEEKWTTYLIELNIRKGGTTHTEQWAEYLTGARLTEGLLTRQDNKPVYYYSSEKGSLRDEFSQLSTSNFLAQVNKAGLAYSQLTQSGIFFHLLSQRAPFHKVGYTAIGRTRSETIELKKKFEEKFGK
ncbi:MAG: hypothetical protein COW24_03740 [Candidatus Kerfeldbacteria bacterium CG15_BIG_FIL_POST_REV_8_21_14_020_45_12]|uniref:ATP-grasp domain-containing protein n=1 Tax=Candidatus Kerfeldbacteria bacterium CG15_BIG_FIL_POST_REV_8_21_14_020_45_12 TaxID=2014247 RepID=A0A2M7H3G9_9BACT|nr:MAG: hypothetical protein COW24_03740 [Candidatus Kerfeldbacteria bacterium CG15_BIG_FIL_POST_REV_8_21_14_020_45_12]PJA93812.1 MAG: hypothetical protein CO132_01345 [Candidatus Kerfeldbacteria bacterium CG_4_9_14_3_um_filter_45_8]